MFYNDVFHHMCRVGGDHPFLFQKDTAEVIWVYEML